MERKKKEINEETAPACSVSGLPASVINGEQASLKDTEDLRELVPLEDEGLQETFDSEVSTYVTSVRTHL